MKHLLLFLLLVPTLAFGQRLIQIRPVVSTTEVDSIATTINSTSVELHDDAVGDFASVTAGMRVEGNSIPFGTTVVSNSGDTLLVLSNAATATVALDSLRFGYFTSLAYADGDALGFPFSIGSVRKVHSVFVADDADQMTSLELYFFVDTFSESEDNAAFAPSDADVDKIVGYRVLGVTQDLGGAKIVTMDDTELPLDLPMTRDSSGESRIIVQMVSTGAWTFTAVNNITINFIVE